MPTKTSVPTRSAVERSAGAIVFRRASGKIYYLLLHYEEGHWDFPKGHVEKGEKTEQTVRREIEEETGIQTIRLIPEFKETIRYFFFSGKRRILKFVVYLLAQTSQKKVMLSHEHTNSLWLPASEAVPRITFATSRKVLEKADRFLAP